MPLLGGVEDKTRPSLGSSEHRLTIRGVVVMGASRSRTDAPMHPILARGGRLALYLALWVVVGVLLGALLVAQTASAGSAAALVALPLALALRVRLPVGVVRVARHAARGDRRACASSRPR